MRGSLVFWFLFIIFRFILRRDVGSLGIGDFLFVVIVADASQNAMSGDSETFLDGALLVMTLLGWNLLFDYLGYRFPLVRQFTESSSMMLVRNGEIQWKNLRREWITKEELMSKMREEGLEKLEQVKEMRLEPDGRISVIRLSA
ncbi:MULTISPECIES: DUF421 domain-containing protein [Methylobacillus]|uniref:Putative membrane protein n=1 Tax=Methylobacillus flagellatus (strain ATCC 51484 / DSM 6875 / VKM B-1610 / KT) TaxID=265072 RepID=Q1H3J5_METFK|nr:MULTISPECIES: YetF domain-containing protein [Methylobacillus]ABE48942.1 putative membrane protein [Methylobacillus flagellatus KT]